MLSKPSCRCADVYTMILAAIVSPNSAISAETESVMLEGSFEIGGATAFDPPPNEPRNTHLRLHLTGEAAKALYRNMQVDAQPSPCTGGPSKIIGDTECAIVDGKYECWFAININAQTIQGGWTC